MKTIKKKHADTFEVWRKRQTNRRDGRSSPNDSRISSNEVGRMERGRNRERQREREREEWRERKREREREREE